MFNSLESSLIMSRAVRENRDYDSAVRVRLLFLARFFLLYRFQGSLRSFRGFPQASLTNIPKPPPFVKHFFAVFSKKSASPDNRERRPLQAQIWRLAIGPDIPYLEKTAP